MLYLLYFHCKIIILQNLIIIKLLLINQLNFYQLFIQISQDPEIPLEIQSASSFEENFPPTNVLANDPLSAGWRTLKSSQLPQEIVFKLQYSQISQIQFVLHETYIPEIIEVYISKEDTPSDFTRLGHVKRNAQTNKGCRERKTLKIKMPATFIKLVITQVAKTQDNKTNQISLCAISVRGIEINSNGEMLAQKLQQQGVAQNPHIQLCDQVKQELQIRKQQAIQLNQYLEANRFKVTIDKLSNLQSALEQLEIKKQIAIDKEDFIQANDMNTNIQQIEKVIEMPIDQVICFCNGEKYEKTQYAGTIRQQMERQTLMASQTQQQPQQAQEQQTQIQQQQSLQASLPNAADERPLPALNKIKNAEDAVPQMNKPIANEEQAIEANNQGWFQASDDELKQLEKERKERAMQKLKEREAKLGNNVNIASVKKVQQSTIQEGGSAKQQSQTNEQPTDQQVFAYKEYDFNFQDQQQALIQFLSAEVQELPKQFDGSEEVAILQQANFRQDLISVLAQKSVEQIQSVAQFFITLLRVNPIEYHKSAQAAILMMCKSQNIALLGLKEVMSLICYYFISCLYKDCPGLKDQIELDFEFPNIDDQLANQKDQAIRIANMTAFNKTSKVGDVQALIENSVKSNQQYMNQDMNQILQQLVSRVAAGQKRPRLVAINILDTLASFSGFPIQLLSQLLFSTKISVEGAKNMKNTKYATVIESRINAASMIWQDNPYIANEQAIVQLFSNYLKEILNQVTKQDCKNNFLQIIEVIIQQNQNVQNLIDVINNSGLNNQLLKQITQKINEKRNIFQYQEDVNKIKITVQQSQQQSGNQQVQCQFCLWQVPDDVKDKNESLRQHLLKQCSCCCICPACHQVVEIAIIYQHIITECNNRQNYYQKIGGELMLCNKCQLGIKKSEMAEHLKKCNVELQTEDQTICPICGVLLNGVEETLDHYAQNQCSANPRTSQKLLEVIQNKVNK